MNPGLLHELTKLLGEDSVLHKLEDLFLYEYDGSVEKGLPDVVVFPTTTEHVSQTVKLAAKYRNNQGEVWQKVAVAQGKLKASLAVPVSSAESNSSLQLTLENKSVQESSEVYIKHLSPIIEKETDVVGYAFAINGRFNSADVYASGALFRRLWPKLLKASSVEAITELHKDKKFEPASRETRRYRLRISIWIGRVTGRTVAAPKAEWP